MINKYIYPAIFEPGAEHGYCITFPDLPGIITSGETIEESLLMAKEALELHIYGMEEDGGILPEPTPPNKINIPEGGFVSLVDVWMPLVRDEMANKSIKKTLTIPKWLNDAAEKKQVNFSQILQAGIKHYLGIDKPTYLEK
jgi:predicted RNase H-like HicB family nuclease